MSKLIDSLLESKIMHPVIGLLGKGYLAGHSLEEVLRTSEEYRQRGLNSTIAILAEAARSVEEADSYLEAYKKIIDNVSQKYPNQDVASVSVKPTAICVAGPDKELLSETPLDERLEELVDYAERRGVKVTLDMEEHHWTDISIRAARRMWASGHRNFGIVLQSKLNRTQGDIIRVFNLATYSTRDEYIRVRAVTGVYKEPDDIATNDKGAAKERLVERIGELFDAGVYVEIATHDHSVIKKIITEVIEPRLERGKITRDGFEFQFLYGVQKAYDISQSLRGSGYKVRYYLPVELKKGDSIPYMIRRLKENSELWALGYKNLKDRVKALITGRQTVAQA